MESNFYLQVLKVFVLLPVVILLIVVVLKNGGKYLSNMNNGRIIKVNERVALGKDTFLIVATIGDKPYLLSSGQNGIEIIKELDEDIVPKYKTNFTLNKENINPSLMNYLDRIRGKVKNEKV